MSIPLVEWDRYVREPEAAAPAPPEPLKLRLIRAVIGYVVFALFVVLLRFA
jgi:hypothetical protein